jgi:predicted nucleic-acid-binding Zn-ribbon protein
MPILIRCPSCSYKDDSPTLFRGRTVQCPKCSSQFAVDSSIQPHRLTDEPITSLPQPFRVVTASATAENCPYCGKSISPRPKRSRKCPHCGQQVYVRRGVVVTLEVAKAHDEEFQVLSPLVSGATAFERMRQAQKRQLEMAREALKSGLARAIEITSCEDHATCDFCRLKHGKRIAIAGCTLAMLPPFKDCEHEQERRVGTDQGCRCYFTILR